MTPKLHESSLFKNQTFISSPKSITIAMDTMEADGLSFKTNTTNSKVILSCGFIALIASALSISKLGERISKASQLHNQRNIIETLNQYLQQKYYPTLTPTLKNIYPTFFFFF